MRYDSFPIENTDAINKFLVKHGDNISAGGVVTDSGRVGFLYEPQDEKERELAAIVSSTQQYIAQQIALLLGAEVDLRYWMGEEIRGRTVADKIGEAKERIRQHQTHIKYARSVLKDAKASKWAAFEETH